MATATAVGVDPFATAPAPAAPGDDPFATPRSVFPDPAWIKGRLVLCYPTEFKKDLPSKEAGKLYDAIVCDLYVVDGGQVPTSVTGLDAPINEGDVISDFRLTSNQFVEGMKRLIGTRTPYLCRIGSGPSKFNKQVTAYWPEVPTDADKIKAKQMMAAKGLL